MKRRIGVVLISCLTLLVPASCREKREPMRELLNSLVVAAENRDADAIGSHLSTSFATRDGESRDTILQRVRRVLAAYSTVSIRISDLRVEEHATFTGAEFRVDFSGTTARSGGLADLLPRNSTYLFWVEIEREGSEWKVVWAEWDEVGESEP